MASSDSFNRSDGAIGTADTGETWTNLISGTTWEVKDNQAFCSDATEAGSTEAEVVIDTGLSDVIIDVDIPHAGRFGSTPAAGVCWRAASATELFYVFDHFLVRKTGGVTTTVVNWSSANRITDGDSVRVIAEGTSMKVYRNGTEVASWSDSANQTATKHGLASFDNNSGIPLINRFDNFNVDPVSNMHVGYVAMGVA